MALIQNTYNFIHSAPPQAQNIGRISIAKTLALSLAARPSGRIANWDLFCQAKRLPAADLPPAPIAAVAKNIFFVSRI
jgi:hypothetical protein